MADRQLGSGRIAVSKRWRRENPLTTIVNGNQAHTPGEPHVTRSKGKGDVDLTIVKEEASALVRGGLHQKLAHKLCLWRVVSNLRNGFVHVHRTARLGKGQAAYIRWWCRRRGGGGD